MQEMKNQKGRQTDWKERERERKKGEDKIHVHVHSILVR